MYYRHIDCLAPNNDIVDYINEYMSAQLPGEATTYLSMDSPHADLMQTDRIDDVHSVEYLNTISSSGLPKHKLHLKVGVPIMLLRNVDYATAHSS